MIQLRFAAHDVIERLMLPELSRTSAGEVDLPCAAAFPALDAVTQHCSFQWFDESVKVIGHDDPGVEMIITIMSCRELAGEHCGMNRTGQNAFTMPGIQQFMEACGEFAV